VAATLAAAMEGIAAMSELQQPREETDRGGKGDQAEAATVSCRVAVAHSGHR